MNGLCTRIGTALALLGLLAGSAAAQPEGPARVEMTEGARLAVARGLAYLKEQQQTNGAWRADVGYKLNFSYQATARGADHVGVTALACMAFMAAGNLPGRGKYGEQVRKGLEYILAQERDGFITDNGSRMYSHAFASLFLAEVYGMTQNPKVRDALKAAVKLIVDSQNARGGWRYAPGAQDSDMSIVVCQVQALRAANNVGIAVPIHVIRQAQRYVRDSSQPNGSFKYQAEPISRDSFALTAAGVTALHGTSVYSHVMIERGLEYLLSRGRHERYGTYFFWYGHYYAVQAMYIGGLKWPRMWQAWYPFVRDKLVSRQRADGSWDSVLGPGTNFSTAMGALILQIPYRYLPIFQR